MKPWLYLLICLFLYNLPVDAFDSKGHKYLEQEAYRLLRNYPNGPAILDWLVQNNILAKGLPSRSHYPDLSLERQFTQSRQGYHFMTSNFDVLQACRARGNLSQQQQLLLSSLGPCLQMMYYFFREIIENPPGASQAGRGIYVLLHIVADSYSSEHTARDSATVQLLTIKGWKLSRTWWPSPATTPEQDRQTLLLLHRGRHASGDHEWFTLNGRDTVLTSAGINAAQVMCHLLIITYQASQQPSSADSLVCHFFEQHFQPYNSSISNRTFVFNGVTKKVLYNFGDHYERDKKSVIFHYDRFPFYSLMASVQSDYSKRQLFNSFGAEFERYISPRAADKSFALLRRTPVGYGFGMVYYNNREDGSTFTSGLRLKGFVSCSFALPLINASLDPHAGIGIFPAAGSTRFSPLCGADLVWNLGKDWYIINSHPRTIRLTLGYEYDPWNIFLKNSFKLKMGYNTWHGNIVIPKRRRRD